MFHKLKKKPVRSKAQPLTQLTPIITPENFLSDPKRQALITSIRSYSFLPQKSFEALSITLIHNLIQGCQQLPETSNAYYAGLGGMVDAALNRTEAALALFLARLERPLQDKKEATELEKLWQYVLFSAALCLGVGKLVTDFFVNLHDEAGMFLTTWEPFKGPLSLFGKYYEYRLEKGDDFAFRSQLNVLLAKEWMPKAGFLWITEHPKAFSVWLKLLQEDFEGADVLGILLERAEAEAIARYFLDLPPAFMRPQLQRPSAFTGPSPDPLEVAQQIGVDFWRWLQGVCKAEGGKFVLNGGPIFMVPGGLLMLPETFRWFMRDHPQYKNIEAVRHGFLALGLHTKSEHTVRDPISQKTLTGCLISKYSTLLPASVLVQKSGERVQEMSTLALMAERSGHALKVLTAEGDWERREFKEAAAFKPGSKLQG